jgi:hypothetical protein
MILREFPLTPIREAVSQSRVSDYHIRQSSILDLPTHLARIAVYRCILRSQPCRMHRSVQSALFT